MAPSAVADSPLHHSVIANHSGLFRFKNPAHDKRKGKNKGKNKGKGNHKGKDHRVELTRQYEQIEKGKDKGKGVAIVKEPRELTRQDHCGYWCEIIQSLSGDEHKGWREIEYKCVLFNRTQWWGLVGC